MDEAGNLVGNLRRHSRLVIFIAGVSAQVVECGVDDCEEVGGGAEDSGDFSFLTNFEYSMNLYLSICSSGRTSTWWKRWT